MALGTRMNEVAVMIVLQGLKMTLAGLPIGLAAAFAVGRLLTGLVFGRQYHRRPHLCQCVRLADLHHIAGEYHSGFSSRASRADRDAARRVERRSSHRGSADEAIKALTDTAACNPQ